MASHTTISDSGRPNSLRAWRSGLRACLPNRRCSVRSRPPAPTCHRLVLRVRRFQRWTSRVELPLAGPNCRTKFLTKFLGASPSWPRRRILIPVTAGSSPAALANSSRGLGREGAGSHKAGVAGSTPVPATISGVAVQSLLTSFNGRTLGCGPGDAEFDSPSQDQIPV